MKFRLVRIFLTGALALLLSSAVFSQEGPKKSDGSTSLDQEKSSDVAPIFNFAKGFSNMLGAPKTTAATPNEERKAVRTSGKLMIPQGVDAYAKFTSLSKLDEEIGVFFEQTGGDAFSVLSALKLTDYRQAIALVDLNAPVAVLVFFNSTTPQIAVEIPVAEGNLKPFVDRLVKASKGKIGTVSKDQKTIDFTLGLPNAPSLRARQINSGYALLTNGNDEPVAELFASDANQLPEPPNAFRESVVRLVVTPQGVRRIAEPSRPLWRELAPLFDNLKSSAPTLADVQIDDVRQYIADNILSVEWELALDDYGCYPALTVRPTPNSPNAKRLAFYRSLTPINFEADRFFGVLPDVESALGGQIELPKELAKTLPEPFNRIQFVEYNFGLPADGEYAAESWLFYLEVDDAEEFAREMIVPRAREIGRYVGSKQAENAASQIFGNVAERARERQLNRRRPPRRIADPERASATGAALGSLIGGMIGESSGEESAMKEFRINGFKTYVSDIETFTRQSALMKAEKEGTYVSERKSLFSDGSLSIVDAAISVINGGDQLQRALLQQANNEALNVDDSPLIASKGYLVILDKNTILYSMGNQQLLRLGINNYQASRRPNVRYQTLVNETDSIQSLNKLASNVADFSKVNVVGTTRFDLANAQAYYRWLREYYVPNAPTISGASLPSDTPKPVLLSSVDAGAQVQRMAIPYKLVSNITATYADGANPLELVLKLTQKKDQESNDAPDGEVEFGFDEE